MANQFVFIVFSAFIFISLNQISDISCNDGTYRAYLQNWNKTASSDSILYNQRLQIFCAQVKYVHNQNLVNNYQLGINKFSDLFDYQLPTKSVVKQEDNITNRQQSNQDTDINQIKYTQSSQNLQIAPEVISTNWQNQGKISSIKDQGTCSASWAFAAVGLYQSYLMVKGKHQYDLSEQFILQCTDMVLDSGTTDDCTGGDIANSLQVVTSKGIPLEKDYSYQAVSFDSNAGFPQTDGICDTSAFVKYNYAASTQATTLNSYSDVNVSFIDGLLSDSPVAAKMYADSDFMAYQSGVYSGCPDYATSVSSINHAVVIVAIDSDQNYIIKNSWGTSWGQNGYATISSQNDCGLASSVYQLTWGYQLIRNSLLFLFAFIAFF